MKWLKVLALMALVIIGACGDQITDIVLPPTPPPIIIIVYPPADTTKNQPDTTKTDTTKVVSMRLNPREARLKVGDTITFVATYYNVNGHAIPGTTTSWRSNNSSIVEMLGGGKVQAKAVGTTTVCGAVSSIIDSCAVVIVEASAPSYRIYGVFPSPVYVDLANGSCGQQTQQLKVVITGDGPFPTTVRWTSLNPSIVTVDSLGLATARGAGSGIIRAIAVGDTTKSNVVYVTVKACIVQADTVVTIDPPTASGNPGGEGKLTCTVTGPSSFTDRRCYFESYDATIVQVVQKDTLFTTNTQPWGIGWRAGGTLKYAKVGTTKVCAFLPAAIKVPRACSYITVYAR